MGVRVDLWSFCKEGFEVGLLIEVLLEGFLVITGEPKDYLVDFGFATSFFLYFFDVERVDFGKGHGVDFSVLHGI